VDEYGASDSGTLKGAGVWSGDGDHLYPEERKEVSGL
jgi:hypothetical protein